MPTTACFPHMDLSRRTLFAATAVGAVGTAGCLDGAFGGTDGERSPTDDEVSPTPTDRELPDGCPTTQDLDVEWPAELTDGSVERFVEAYENAYYREAVVDYEPITMVDEYGLAASVSDGPVTVDGGYEVALSGGGGVYEPGLHLQAEPADPPAGADVVPVGEVSDDTLRGVLETAAAGGEAETRVRRPRERVDELIERVASLSADAGPLEGPGDSSTSKYAVVESPGPSSGSASAESDATRSISSSTRSRGRRTRASASPSSAAVSRTPRRVSSDTSPIGTTSARARPRPVSDGHASGSTN